MPTAPRKSPDASRPKSSMYPRIDESPSPEAHPTVEERKNMDTGTGDDTPKVRVPSQPDDQVRNTPPAGEWDDTFKKR